MLSKRLQFVRVAPDGSAAFAGWAPHLDLEPLAPADRPLLKDVLAAPWIRADQEQRALALAAATLVPEHFKEVAERRIAHVDKTLAAVHERLTKEIAFWSDRWIKLKDDQEAGKDVRLNLENARRTVTDLEGRLENRKKELQSMRHVTSATPVVLGGALVVPAGLLRQTARRTCREYGSAFSDRPRRPSPRSKSSPWTPCAALRKRAAAAWSMSPPRNAAGISRPTRPPSMASSPSSPHRGQGPRQGRRHGHRHAQRNALRLQPGATNSCSPSCSWARDDTVDGPHYLRNPFDAEPGWGVSSVNYDLKALLAARGPHRHELSRSNLPASSSRSRCRSTRSTWNDASEEKASRRGHPTLHKWWARRPLAAARAVLFAQLVNDPGYQQGGGFKYGKNKKEAAAERKRLFRIIEELMLWDNT